MMNPWDRERTYRDTEDNTPVAPSGGSGMLWLISIIIAVVGLVLMAKHGSNHVVLVPIGISLFFMTMFWVSHRRESQAIAKRRAFNLLLERERAHDVELNHTPQAGALYAPVQQASSVVPAADVNLRRVFDRFDLKVINLGRDWGWTPKDIASFLDYARDYVDTQHASSLMQTNEKGELERHLDAAVERALLQHDIEHPDQPKRGRPHQSGSYDPMEPPF
jgi:hypothetical protein